MNFREQQEFLEKKLLSHRASRSANSKRVHDEEPDMFRTAYQRDIGRILYSDVFRRLRLKTQVFMASDIDQHSRTRLTHTLEVSQMAKSIAKCLELNVDLVEAIALGHDLGHMPFGHAGETAINNIMKEKGKSFNHNVQSVWLLEQLLFARKNLNGEMYTGLNLTLDTLEGIWKHTKTTEQSTEYIGLSKLNPESKGSLEAQIVNISDSISYCNHDLYDAVRKNIVTYDEFIADVWVKHFNEKFDESHWFNSFIFDLIENNQESDEIKFSEKYQEAYKDIRKFIYERIVSSDKVREYDLECINMISEIYNYYEKNIDQLLEINKPNVYKYNTFGAERVIVDYIQWFGDSKAVQEYEKIKNRQL